jgi:hypothetical protein
VTGRRPDQKGRLAQPLSPAGASAAQISGLGLATEATAAQIQGNTGTALSTGVPPGVPGVRSAFQLFGTVGGSPYNMFSFTFNGRVWAASLSFTIAANSSYAGSTSNVYAQIVTASGITLLIIELVVTNLNQTDSNAVSVPLNGINIVSGDTLMLDVNNGVAVTNTVMRASGSVLYSVP